MAFSEDQQEQKVLWMYSKQISGGCTKSTIDVELFKLCQQLTISDWRKMRGKDFWDKYDSYESQFDRNNFVYHAVLKYMKNKSD